MNNCIIYWSTSSTNSQPLVITIFIQVVRPSVRIWVCKFSNSSKIPWYKLVYTFILYFNTSKLYEVPSTIYYIGKLPDQVKLSSKWQIIYLEKIYRLVSSNIDLVSSISESDLLGDFSSLPFSRGVTSFIFLCDVWQDKGTPSLVSSSGLYQLLLTRET